MEKDLVINNGREVFRVPVTVTLCDGYVRFKCPRVSYVGHFSSYRLDKYRFVNRVMNNYCSVNAFFVECPVRAETSPVYASKYCKKRLDFKKE